MESPADPDLFARLAIGRLIAKKGVYLFDPFGFTPRKDLFVDHEWFSGYAFYLISLLRADWAFVVFRCVTMTVSIYLLYLACLEWNKGKVNCFSFLFGVVQCLYIWFSVVRSQVFTYMLIPLLLLGICRFERRASASTLSLMPIAMLLWANSHGGFVVGFAFLGLYVCILSIRRDFRRLIVVLSCIGACVIATSINPYGFRLFWLFVIEAVSMPRPTISEWQPLSFFVAADILNFFYLGVIIIGLYIKRKNIEKIELLFLFVSSIEGIMHQRLFAITAMIAIVFCQGYFEATLSAFRNHFSSVYQSISRSSAFALLLLSIPLLLFSLFRLATISSHRLDFSKYPVYALESLRQSKESGKLLVDFNLGSFALWRLYPKFLVSLDGRYEEVYPESTVKLVSESLCPSCENFLNSFQTVDPDFVVVSAKDEANKMLAKIGKAWSVAYMDEEFAILSKKELSLISRRDLGNIKMWEPLF
ncbi:MAG: hypothetical protein GYA55_05460 [SAR324 cluster bacterium]|uniref:Glycosyltransferase RgtA/B/C/D-like domain-containing protein n=1 Tax=SAR324 cluster bacterium TaxID=2024889 RepID=A0A7X9FQT1_9DELT|nr:hypothetical protein [SAR324 cluster bacterium]